MRVCIIGAGVSGLATAKVFLSQGHAVTLFEQRDTLGGVWSPARRYPGVRLQTKRDYYCFSDFPMPGHYPEFPSGQQVYEYLCAYAKHFQVDQAIEVRTEVRSVVARADGKPGWRVHVRGLDTGNEGTHDYDFVVVCNGTFSQPNLPQFAGRDEFEQNGGVVLHSSDLHDLDQMAGRSVVVVGFGKSALDIAEASLARARSSAIIARGVPWKVPHRLLGRAHIMHFILSRFTEIWFPHPGMGAGRRFLHTWLRPLVNAYWRASEFVISRQVGLNSPDLRPDVPLRRAASCVTLTLDNLKLIRNGSILFHRGAVARFVPNGIELADGRRIDAEVVVLATGYRQDVPFLCATEKAKLFDADGSFLLYRALVSPGIPAMAFNGYNGVGACQLTAEVGAIWLVGWLTGRVEMPDCAAMLAAIRKELEVRRRLLSAGAHSGSYVSPFPFGYLDQLLRDLGLPPADQHRRHFDWLFTPLQPTDYRGLLEKIQQD